MWLELCINWTLRLLQEKQLTKGDQLEISYAVSLLFLIGSVCFPPTVVASVKGLYPRCECQLRSLELVTILDKAWEDTPLKPKLDELLSQNKVSVYLWW
jgi:hypothetical protein